MRFAAGDGNLRRYVGNDAPNLTDPSGLDVIYLFDPTSHNPLLAAFDPRLGNYGHGAVLIGNDKRGWRYYSFSTGNSKLTTRDNLQELKFKKLADAAKSPALTRYSKGGYIRWHTSGAADLRAIAAAQRFNKQVWLPIQNCNDLSAAAIRAAGINGFVPGLVRVGDTAAGALIQLFGPRIIVPIGSLIAIPFFPTNPLLGVRLVRQVSSRLIAFIINSNVSLPRNSFVQTSAIIMGQQFLSGTGSPLFVGGVAATPQVQIGLWPPK